MMDEFFGLSTDDSLMSNNSSMNGDRNLPNSVFLRFSELEKKISEQGDEIVCLKSTLADVLRRLNQLEGRAIVTTSFQQSSHNHKNVFNNSGNRLLIKSHGKNLALTNGSLNSEHIYHNNNHRRYSSSTSLQSEFNGSNSVSPISSSPQPNNAYPNRSISIITANNCSVINNGHSGKPMIRMNSASNLRSMKRWSASQEIRSSMDHTKKYSGSLFNLHALKNASSGNLTKSRSGNIFKDVQYSQGDGVIKFNIMDRPITINIPTKLLQTYTLQSVSNPPPQRLKLDWVYGYRGRDCRHNLYLLPTGEIVYFIAAVVVLFNVDDQIQRHYTGHSSEIRCLTVHPNKLLIATGQNACNDSGRFDKRAHVRIWDSVSLNTMHILGQNGEFDRGISCLTFSKFDGGNLLCVVDDSSDHVVSLWEWHKGSSGHKISESKSTCDSVLAAEFHPIEKNILITIGKGHIFFWDIECGSLVKKIGVFEKQDKPKYMLCVAFNDVGELLTGDSNGNINIWHRNSCRLIKTIFNAHDGSIFDICSLKDGTFVTGGGKDKKIIEWDSSMNKTGREAKLPDQYGGIRTLTTGKGSMIIIGTTRNCILQGTMALNFSLVVQGHIDDLCALAIHPTQNQFITAGYDYNVHLWDTMSHSVVWSKDIGESVHSAAFSPDGNVFIISTTTTPGTWMIFEATTRQHIFTHTDGTELIECIKFSPDGRYLALGSRDNNIYIYQVGSEYKKFNKMGRCCGHTSYVITIDWDTTNTYIQTNSISFEHLFWNATICRQVVNDAIIRDLEFVTHNSLIGFSVFGIWPESLEGPKICAGDRSHNQKLFVVGDDIGRLNLYSYPACQLKCLHHSFPGHCSAIPRIQFLADDSRVISVGGRDSSILQWTVT